MSVRSGLLASRIILDTDILSEIFKERNETVLIHAERYLRNHKKLTFMSVSASELLFGLYAKDARGANRQSARVSIGSR